MKALPYKDRDKYLAYQRDYFHKTNPNHPSEKICSFCKTPFQVSKEHWGYCSNSCFEKAHSRKTNEKFRAKANQSSRETRHKQKILKDALIKELFGNKCQRCRFETEFMIVFDLHHIDGSLKEEKHSPRGRLCFKAFKKWLLVNQFNLKLLCSNCHRIVHLLENDL